MVGSDPLLGRVACLGLHRESALEPLVAGAAGDLAGAGETEGGGLMSRSRRVARTSGRRRSALGDGEDQRRKQRDIAKGMPPAEKVAQRGIHPAHGEAGWGRT